MIHNTRFLLWIAAVLATIAALILMWQPDNKTGALLAQVPTVTPVENPCQPYLVQYGDTITSIALALDVALDELLLVNSLPENVILEQGQALLVPGSGCTITGSGEIVPLSTFCPEGFRRVVIARQGIRAGSPLTRELLQLTCWSEVDNHNPGVAENVSDSVTLIGFDNYVVLFDSVESALGYQMASGVRQWSPLLKTHAFRRIEISETSFRMEPAASVSFTNEPGTEMSYGLNLKMDGFYEFQLGDEIAIEITYLDSSEVEDCLEIGELPDGCIARFHTAIQQETIVGKVTTLNGTFPQSFLSLQVPEADIERIQWLADAGIPFNIYVIEPAIPRLHFD